MYHNILLCIIIILCAIYSSSKYNEYFSDITKEQIKLLRDLRQGSINIKDITNKTDIDAIVQYLAS